MFRWTRRLRRSRSERVTAELSRLPALLRSCAPTIWARTWASTRATSTSRSAADFDDLEGYLTYRDNPEHRAIIAEFIRPITAERAAVQYEF